MSGLDKVVNNDSMDLGVEGAVTEIVDAVDNAEVVEVSSEDTAEVVDIEDVTPEESVEIEMYTSTEEVEGAECEDDTIELEPEDLNLAAEPEQADTAEMEDFTPPANVTFGGLSELSEPVKEEPRVVLMPVPVKENAEMVEKQLRTFAVGSTHNLLVLAEKIRKAPGKISTGIPELDEITGGGWSAGLNTVAAAPGTGKTTILIQSAVQMAQQGTAVVYITNDMRALDLECKVISGLSYSMVQKACLTVGDILNRGALDQNSQHVKDLMKKAGQTMQYLHIRDLIYDEEFDRACNENPAMVEMDKIERIFWLYCNIYEKVVFIADSLQQIAGYTAGGKEGVDSQLRQFKQLSRKYSVPIIMISTLNRTGYSKQDRISFSDLKESGAIEYDSDTIVTMVPLFAVDPNIEMELHEFKKNAERDILLSCIKSRDSGEKDAKMTLYAPGCTFIPYEEDRRREEQGLGFSGLNKKRKSKSKGAALPPLGSMDWASASLS